MSATTRLAAASLTVATLTTAASAQGVPEGCSGFGLALEFQAYVNGAPMTEAHTGQEISYRVTLHNTSPVGCNVQGGQLSLTLPDGQVVELAGYPGTPDVPMVEFGVPVLFESPVPYIATADDADDDQLIAYADYGPTANQPGQLPGAILSDPILLGAGVSEMHVMQLLPEPCAADIDGDGEVAVLDLIEVMVSWGMCPHELDLCPADLNQDGAVDVLDLIEVLTNWGDC
jgi:hypothetical protein